MSPFLVYLLMKADDMQRMFDALTFAAFLLTVIAWFARGVIFEMDEEETPTVIVKASRRFPWLCASLFVAAALMPGTKTIAAMIILPKITSPAALDAMGSEAHELYNLAKDALKGLAPAPAPAAPAK